MDVDQSLGRSNITLRHDATLPRLRINRTPTAARPSTSKRPEEVDLPTSSSSSSSPTPGRRQHIVDAGLSSSNHLENGDARTSFSQQARTSLLSTSSSSDSPAARLRAITDRVTSIHASTSRSPSSKPIDQETSTSWTANGPVSSPELVYFETASEAGTYLAPTSRAQNARGRQRSPHLEVESDVESMAEHMAARDGRVPASSSSASGSSRKPTATEKLKELYARLNIRDEEGESTIAQDIKNAGLRTAFATGNAASSSGPAEPRQRIRTNSLTSPTTHQRNNAPRESLSDEDANPAVRPHDPRKRPTTPSVNLLRAHIDSQNLDNDSPQSTPAQHTKVHPLHAEIESTNLSVELENPTPFRPHRRHGHLSFSQPLHTSTPRPQPVSISDSNLTTSTSSSATMSPFRPPPRSGALKAAFHQPPSPTLRSSPAPGGGRGSTRLFPQGLVTKRKRMSVTFSRGQEQQEQDENSQHRPDDERSDGSQEESNERKEAQFALGSRSAPISIASTSEANIYIGTDGGQSQVIGQVADELERDGHEADVDDSEVDHSRRESSFANGRRVGGGPRSFAAPGTSSRYDVEEVEDVDMSTSSFGATFRSITPRAERTRRDEHELSQPIPTPIGLPSAVPQPSAISVPRSNPLDETSFRQSESTTSSPVPSSARPLAAPHSSSPPSSSPVTSTFASKSTRERDLERLRKATATPTSSPSPKRAGPRAPVPEDVDEMGGSEDVSAEDEREERFPPIRPSLAPRTPQAVERSRSGDHDRRDLDSDDGLPQPPPSLIMNPTSNANMSFSRGSALFGTPPRTRHLASTPASMLQTPPRPDGLPDLPEPPSSDEGSPEVSKSTGAPSTVPENIPFGSKLGEGRRPASTYPPKTPKPPGSWDPNTPRPSRSAGSDSLPVEDSRLPPRPPHISDQSSERDATVRTPTRANPPSSYANVQTPAPPGSWALNTNNSLGASSSALSVPVASLDPPPPDADTLFVPESTSTPYASMYTSSEPDIASPSPSTPLPPSAPTSGFQTPAPPGAWVSNSAALRKGILKVRFDETSVASWHELQKASAMEAALAAVARGESGGSSDDETIPRRRERPRKPIPAGFEVNEPEIGPHPETNSASGSGITTRKRRSRLKMVDEFGNEIGEQEAPLDEQKDPIEVKGELVDDDAPHTAEELRGLRRVARALPQLAQEFAEESMSITAPIPLTSLADQLKHKDKIASLSSQSRVARTERARLQRVLQLGPDAAIRSKSGEVSSTPRPSRSRWFLFLLFAELAVFYIVLRFTASRAEQLFLMTHYDPFFPALYSPPLPTAPLSSRATMLELFLQTILGPTNAVVAQPQSTNILFGLTRGSVPAVVVDFLDWIFQILSTLQGYWAYDTELALQSTWVPS